MTKLKTAQHQRILEDPKKEKKDGLSEYLDQKKKLDSYK